MLYDRLSRVITIATCFLGLAIFPLTAISQTLHWEVAVPIDDGVNRLYLMSLSSYGESCTACGEFVPDSTVKVNRPAVYLKFLRSDDAGLTWKIQDPHLPLMRDQSQINIRRVQMIDSLNVVAIGDSGLFLKTTDAGNTWQSQRIGTKRLLRLDFSNPATGIISAELPPNLYWTHDGGINWKNATLFAYADSAYPPYDVESMGGDAFRAIPYQAGPFYYTYDDFRTVDTSRWLYPFEDFPHVITDFVSSGVDTVLGFGFNLTSWSKGSFRSTLLWTTDGGSSWNVPSFDDTVLKDVQFVSSLREPYVLLGGLRGVASYVGISFDHGVSWNFDSLDVQSDLCRVARSGTVTPGGVAIVMVSGNEGVSESAILRGTLRSTNDVEQYERIVYGTRIYPNPATNAVTIQSVDPNRTIRVFDILGRTVGHAKFDDNGKTTLDVTHFAPGIYSVVLYHGATAIPIGRFSVTK